MISRGAGADHPVPGDRDVPGFRRTHPSGRGRSGRPRQPPSRTFAASSRAKPRHKVVGRADGLTRFAEASRTCGWRVNGPVWSSRADAHREQCDTYRRQLRNHVLPALGEMRLGEITTPAVDRVLAGIRRKVSGASAKSCRSVISGVMSSAVRHGAVTVNPVREVQPIDARPARAPRALSQRERTQLLVQVSADPRAQRRRPPGPGVLHARHRCPHRRGAGVMWSEVDLDAGTVEISSTLIRVQGGGPAAQGDQDPQRRADAGPAVERDRACCGGGS